jgi:hypothetical protein
MQHVGRSLRSAAHLAPLPGEARRKGLWSGGLVCASGPNLRHLVLAFEGLRWIKALLDASRGGGPGASPSGTSPMSFLSAAKEAAVQSHT